MPSEYFHLFRGIILPETQDIQNVPSFASSESNQSDILPGSDIIGRGIDVFGPYCDGSYLKPKIIDIGELNDTENIRNQRTSSMVEVFTDKKGLGESISGQSLSQFSKDFSAQVQMEGSYEFFKGELDASFQSSEQRKSATQFVQHNLNLVEYGLELPTYPGLRGHLTKDAKRDFLKKPLPANELVELYGAFYLSRIFMGARCSYSCEIKTTDYSSSVDISVAAKASFESLAGTASAKGSDDITSAVSVLQSKAKTVVRIYGGDPETTASVMQGDLNTWSKTVSENLQFCDCAGGLVRISMLVKDEKRRQEIDDAIDAKLAKHGLPDVSNLVPIHAFHTGKIASRWYFTSTPNDAPNDFGYSKTPFYGLTKEASENDPNVVPIYRLSANNPDRYMLSKNNKDRSGWSNAKTAFYAYNIPPESGDVLQVFSFYCKNTPATSGWYYNLGPNVHGWISDNSNTFFVPVNP